MNDVPLRIQPRYRWHFQPGYDAVVAQYFRQRLQPGMTCFSVGANIGIYPLQFASWTAPNGKVVAFEPNPNSVSQLREHVRLNGLEDRVEAVEEAVADRPGTGEFFFEGTSGMSRLGAPNPRLESVASQTTVCMTTLDAFCGAHGISADALMVDVEGFEFRVLEGASRLFRHKVPVTVIEMHPNAWSIAGMSTGDVHHILRTLRLRVIPLSGQQDPLAEYGHVALEREQR